MDVCRVIIGKIVDKNPANNIGSTPLHYAANNGYLDICRLIINNVDNMLPYNNAGKTPKDLADLNNRVAVSALFEF